MTAAFGVAGVLYALLAPRWYQSVLTVMPVKAQGGGGGLSSLLAGADAGGLAAGFLQGAAGADAARITAVLQSVAVTDAVIEKFDLRARYREEYQENARDELWRHCDVRMLTKPGLVQVSCEDKDPEFAKRMLEYFAEYGNKVFRRVGVSSASEEVRFLEARVAELRQQADETATRMREFQEKHRIVDLDSQAKAVVAALAALNNQSITKQMEVDFARRFSSREESSRQRLEAQLSIVEDMASGLQAAPQLESPPGEKQARRTKATGELFPVALEVPRLRADFEKLYRDRKVAEATLVFALERLEGAKANEARDVSTFLVLDPPTLPTKPSRPKKRAAVLLALFVGFVGALGTEAWRSGVLMALLRGTTPSPGGEAEAGADQRPG
ncbi:MAG: hypothetical protein U0229_09465 [Anaeromyxobacter sp.]